MNDNELLFTPIWASQFCGHTDESLLAALGVLAGLIDSPRAFENCAVAIRRRMGVTGDRTQLKGLILHEVAQKHGVSVTDILGESRLPIVCAARHEACYRLREEMKLSYARIGTIMGDRDHTTILYSYRQHKAKLTGTAYRRSNGHLTHVPA